MAVHSYLAETVGGMVVGASFSDDHGAQTAVDLLHDSGVRWQDISVIARNRARAENIAGDRAWIPGRGRGVLGIFAALRPGGGLPREVRRRYDAALRRGQVVIVVAAGGQPPDTLASLLAQANGEGVDAWWSGPVPIFPPPELAGPF